MLSPIAKRRAYEQAADQIAGRSRDGAWPPGAAYLAAERCNADELAAIDDLLNRAETFLEDAGSVELFRVNPDFHMAIACASGNAMLRHVQRALVSAELTATTWRSSPLNSSAA